MSPYPTRLIHALCAVTLLAGTARAEELTLETGETSGEVYFLWQATLNQIGARSGRLSEMSSFDRVYSKGLLEKLLICEIRELDTDRPLEFNYVIPSRYRLSAELRDVHGRPVQVRENSSLLRNAEGLVIGAVKVGLGVVMPASSTSVPPTCSQK